MTVLTRQDRPRKGHSKPLAADVLANGGTGGSVIVADRYRSVVFPNRVREHRLKRGHPKLLAFAGSIPEIPYIRLSKIERGEVFPRAIELVRIAGTLDVEPKDLLIDVQSPQFDLETWFAPFADTAVLDDQREAETAVALAAAIRATRAGDPTLSPAVIDSDFGIAPVILSRLENAQKGLLRWGAPTVASLCRFFHVADETALRAHLDQMHACGALDQFLHEIGGPEDRRARTRQRIAALRQELAHAERISAPVAPASVRSALPSGQTVGASVRLATVYGVPLADGAIAMQPTGATVELPSFAGPRAFGLRVGRAPLGSGLPGHATVIVDPDRYPQAGGIALVKSGEGHRLMAVSLDPRGAMTAHGLDPADSVALDTLAPADAVAVIAAYHV